MRRNTALIKARFALLWERSAPVLAGPAGLFALYVIAALFGVFEALGDPWRLITLAVITGGSAGWVYWRAGAFKWPNRREAQRRVEDDSGLTDRPFEALEDNPASGSDALWDTHRARMLSRLDAARSRRPQAAWGKIDPYGIRISLGLVALTAGIFAGDLAGPRLTDAFAPRMLAGGGQSVQVDLWVEPPAYTGAPTLFLRERRTAQAPEGSVLIARIAGLNRRPGISGAPFEHESLSDGVQLVRITPERSGAVSIRAGRLNEQITLTLIEDTPPLLSFAADPEGDAQGRLKLTFFAEDDYGLETVQLEYARATENGDGQASSNAYEIYELAPGEIGPAQADGAREAAIDLSRSTLAGERVVIRLAGFDGAGQRGVSTEMTLTLPQRIFLDPLARAVADERRRFLQVSTPYAPMPETALADRPFLDDQPSRRLERAPDNVQRLANVLSAVSDAPALYFDDAVVWLGVRTALHEVRRAREINELDHLDSDLWSIALRAELGSLADAEAALRAAERALSDALARGADQIELSALFDAFDQAMANYMQLLAQQAAEAGRFADGGGAGGMNSDMLQDLLDALREAAELGDTEGSRRALAQLLELLRNMQVTLGQGGGEGDAESPMERAMREALEELSETINEQRGLMEDTFNAERENQQAGSGQAGRDPLSDPLEPGAAEPGQSTDAEDGPQSFQNQQSGQGPRLEDLAEPQSDLTGTLGGLDGTLPDSEAGEDARDALGQAREAMEGAARALSQGDGDQALADQDAALDELRAASQAIAEALEQMGDQQGDGTDPLGRGSAPGEGVDIPDESERQRARDILEELRRRAAERGRSQEELDYIDRLLERF